MTAIGCFHERELPRCPNCAGPWPDDCLGPYCGECMPEYLAFLDTLRDYEERVAKGEG
jgi:hypothetical protein